MSLFSVDMPPGPNGETRTFVAKQKISPEAPRYGRFGDDDEARGRLSQWAMTRFIQAVRAKVPELQRMRTHELYYSGFHWEDPLTNRSNAVRNFCFSIVETIHPVLTEQRPRPEIVLRRNYGDPGLADQLNEVAQWLMDVNGWDLSRSVNTREKLKLGWNVYLLQTDANGICRPLPFPAWDFYKDPAATNDDEMEFYFLARPVPTDWLIDQYDDPDRYPWLFNDDGTTKILPDSIVSPGYDALERPYLTANTSGREHYFDPESIVASVASLAADNWNETIPASVAGGGTTNLVRSTINERRLHGRTTFLVQMFCRDRTYVEDIYTGDIGIQSNGDVPFDFTPSAQGYRKVRPTCEAGWRVIQVCADGTFLDTEPLDPCFCGRNIEIGRNHPQVGRFYPPGELDNAVPLNRSINARTTMLNRALEYEAVPILVRDSDAGTEIDNRAVEPGDTLTKQRGSDIHWMELSSVGQQHFEMLAVEKQDLKDISGVQDVSEGRRPAGIEAAAAIRSLQQAAQTRVRGKEIPDFDEQCRILKKCMVATGKKARGPIWYKGSDGNMKSIDPRLLCYEYDIRMAPSSGTAIGRAEQEEKVLSLHGQGLVDTQTALERLNIKGIGSIMDRLKQQASGQPPVDPAKLITALAALLAAVPSSASYTQQQDALAMAGLKPAPMDPAQQHLAVTQHKAAEEEAKPQPAPVIAGKGNGDNRPAGAR